MGSQAGPVQPERGKCLYSSGRLPSGYETVVFLDKEKIPARREAWEYESALEVFGKPETLKGEKITVFLTLPENWETCRHLGVFCP